MRIVIVGSGGRVGGALTRHFRLAGFPVVAFDRTALDLTRPDLIRDRLEPIGFDALLLTAAVTNLDFAETHPAETQAANVQGPALIASLCAQRAARLVHFSTDYVYDGTHPGPRRESDPTAPLSVYARTKADSEQRVLEATDGAALVARVSWIFGPDRPSFPDQILARARAGQPVQAVTDKYSMPTSALDLASWLHPFVDGPHRNFGGILNFCHAGAPATWHSYAQTTIDLAAALGIPLRESRVQPMPLSSVAEFKAARPTHTAMSHDRLADLLGYAPRPWPDALRDYLRDYHAPA